MLVTILGSASGLPEANRAHASLALHNKERIVLLDAGEGACSALARWGLDPLKLKKIYITHTHPDHCVGLFMILQYLHMKRHRKRLDIYLPEDALPAFQPFMNQLYLVRGEINPDFRLLPLRKKHTITRGWTLQTYPTQHLQRWQELGLPGIGTQAFAFRVSSRDRSLFYSGDIADFSDISAVVCRRDLLVLEGAHIDIGRVVEWALETGLKRLVMTHILPGTEALYSALIKSAEKQDLQIILAQDGLKLRL